MPGKSVYAGDISSLGQEALASSLVSVQEAERRRIARELHDDFAQRLVSMTQSLRRLAGKDFAHAEILRTELQALADSAGEIAHDLGRVARSLHPVVLQDLGLSAALESECQRFSACHEIPVEPQIMTCAPGIPALVELSLFRIAQESLLNIAKHAHATEVLVQLLVTPEKLLLSVRDNGCGFSAEGGNGRGGLGMTSMTERMRLVSGKLVVESQPGQGTTVTAIVPAEA